MVLKSWNQKYAAWLMFGEFTNLDVITLDLHQIIEDSSSLHLTYKHIQISTTIRHVKVS